MQHEATPQDRLATLNPQEPTNPKVLAPGMYSSVQWPVQRTGPGLFVPQHKRHYHHRTHLRDPQ